MLRVCTIVLPFYLSHRVVDCIDTRGGDVHHELSKQLCHAFGGYTRTEGGGAWVDDADRLIEEKVAVYTVAVADGDLAEFDSICEWLLEESCEDALFSTRHGVARIDAREAR